MSESPHAGNSFPILQSSGFGESRAVHELAILITTLPMNIHEIREHSQGSSTSTIAQDYCVDQFYRSISSWHQEKPTERISDEKRRFPMNFPYFTGSECQSVSRAVFYKNTTAKWQVIQANLSYHKDVDHLDHLSRRFDQSLRTLLLAYSPGGIDPRHPETRWTERTMRQTLMMLHSWSGLLYNLETKNWRLAGPGCCSQDSCFCNQDKLLRRYGFRSMEMI